MTSKPGIIYLQKDRFQLYSPYLSNILEFRFVPEISRDFDLYNKPAFDNLLRAFVINNKVPAGSFYIIIADNASFIKDFITQPPVVQNPQQGAMQQRPAMPTLDDLQKEANEFLEHIPYDEVAGKTYPLPNGIRAYATNQEMFEGIKTVLEKLGFTIEIVIPSFVFGQEVSTLSALNINTINTIFQKINLVKGYNLLTDPKTDSLIIPEESDEKGVPSGEIIPQGKKENKNLVLIVGISVIALILIITGVILYLQFTALSPNSKAATTQQTPSTPIAVSPTTVAKMPVKDLTVQIVNASASAATVEAVRVSMASYGFKSITIQNQSALGTGQELLIFSSRVDTQTKNSVTVDIRKVLGGILVQEKSDTTSDIIIILGK